ncbi:MAG: hypothetical protein ACHQX1_01160 [Candidatus Micrarchaeales archaeon]
MMEKKTYDMRGKQANIHRLAKFDMEGFIHMVSYRILIFYAFIYGVVMLYSVIIQMNPYLKAFTILFWILITPQLYETVKAFALISSRGLAYGHLSKEHVYLMRSKYGKTGLAYSWIPYVAMLFWAFGLVALVLWWSI